MKVTLRVPANTGLFLVRGLGLAVVDCGLCRMRPWQWRSIKLQESHGRLAILGTYLPRRLTENSQRALQAPGQYRKMKGASLSLRHLGVSI